MGYVGDTPRTARVNVSSSKKVNTMSTKAHLNQAIVSHFLEMKAEDKPDREIVVFEKSSRGEDVLTNSTLNE